MSRHKLLLFVCAALLAACARPRPLAQIPPDRPDARNDAPFEAADYFLEQRVPAGRPLPVERYLVAQRHARTMRRFSLREARLIDPAATREPAATFGAWEFLGPGNVGGRTRGLVVHPRNPNILWVGGATGGVWKTTDAGLSWTPSTDFAPVLSINSLVIDPNDPDTLYAGTGEQTQNWRGAGIFKTSDGGSTWAQIPSTATPDFYFVNNIAVSRTASRIYAATNSGIWATTDGGASWKLSLPAPDGGPAPTLTGGTTHGCFDVAISNATTADVVFAVCHPPGSLQYAIFRNADAAGSGAWTLVHSDPNMWYTQLAVAPSQPSTIYALSVTSDNSSAYAKGLLAVYRSSANGAPGTWTTRTSNRDTTRLNTGILSIDSAYSFVNFCSARAPNFNGQAGYNMALAVDPLDPDIVWAAGIGIFRSDDGGANWGYAYIGDHPDQHFLAFHPAFNGTSNQVVYNVNDGGVYQTAQGRGKTATCSSLTSSVVWTSLNNGYGTTQFYHGVAYPGGAAWFGGTQDNGTVRGTALRGPNQWGSIFGGDGGVSRVDPVNSNTLFVETPHAGLAKSNNGGISYQNASSGLNEETNNYPFVAQYIFDPANSLRMYVGGTRLWRTDDAASRWNPVSAPADQPGGALDNIRAVAVSPADPDLVLFGMNRGRIFRNANALAANGSTVWASTQPRAGNVSHIDFDPQRPSTVYATYTTFNSAAGDGHIYRSLDAGITWSRLDGSGSTGLPDVPVQTLVVDPDDSSRLYVGSDLGVFASFDGGVTWVRDDSPFANAITPTLSIERNGATRYLYAFTYGRGVWRVPLGGGSAAPCAYSIPSSVTADAVGGTVAIDVDTAPDCAWSVTPASNTPGFAAVQAPAFGVGGGKAFLTAPVNRGTSPRSMNLVVQNQVISVTQPALAAAAIGDELSRAFVIPSVPFQGSGGNSAFTQNASDPRHTCTGSPDFKTGWLRFTAVADASLQVSVQGVRSDNANANSGTVVAVYTIDGDSLSTEIGCAAVGKDNSGPLRNAVVRFPVTRGASYAIETGSLATGAASDNAQLAIAIGPAVPVPTFDVGPPEALVNPGRTRRFAAVTQGLPNRAVRWTVVPQVGVISPDGTYTAPAAASPATVTVTAESLADATLRATATLTIQAPAPVSLPAPSVTNAASFRTGPVAPGEVVTIFGSGIGPAGTVTAQVTPQGRLASTLGGTQVLFDNIPAPLVYVTATQVSAIVPYEVASQSNTQMVVVRDGQSTQPISLPVAAVSPAFFTAAASGTGQVAAVNQDGSLNAQVGALPGSIVALYATGEGLTTPGGINGRLANGIVPQPAAPVGVKIGGLDAEVTYAGAAPQSVAGLFQVNVRIPAALRPGAHSVVLTVGGVASRPEVTLAVR